MTSVSHTLNLSAHPKKDKPFVYISPSAIQVHCTFNPLTEDCTEKLKSLTVNNFKPRKRISSSMETCVDHCEKKAISHNGYYAISHILKGFWGILYPKPALSYQTKLTLSDTFSTSPFRKDFPS